MNFRKMIDQFEASRDYSISHIQIESSSLFSNGQQSIQKEGEKKNLEIFSPQSLFKTVDQATLNDQSGKKSIQVTISMPINKNLPKNT